MAAAFTRGVQSTGTAACPKHFALNNSENFRYMGDSVVDERAARELYLKPFEICVKESHPRTMMCSYNKINGTHASENEWLLTKVLRKEWGFTGIVVTDWDDKAEHYRGILGGNNVRMPHGSPKRLQMALKEGLITRQDLVNNVTPILNFLMKLD